MASAIDLTVLSIIYSAVSPYLVRLISRPGGRITPDKSRALGDYLRRLLEEASNSPRFETSTLLMPSSRIPKPNASESSPNVSK